MLLLFTGATSAGVPVVFSGLYKTTVRRKIEALDAEKREGLTAGAPNEVKRIIETLRVDRNG